MILLSANSVPYTVKHDTLVLGTLVSDTPVTDNPIPDIAHPLPLQYYRFIRVGNANLNLSVQLEIIAVQK